MPQRKHRNINGRSSSMSRLYLKLIGSPENVPKGDLSRCSNVREQSCDYSITSSARSGSAGGMFNPITLALLRLITNSYLVGA